MPRRKDAGLPIDILVWMLFISIAFIGAMWKHPDLLQGASFAKVTAMIFVTNAAA